MLVSKPGKNLRMSMLPMGARPKSRCGRLCGEGQSARGGEGRAGTRGWQGRDMAACPFAGATRAVPAQRQVDGADVGPFQQRVKLYVEARVGQRLELFQRAGGREAPKGLDLHGKGVGW